MSEPAIQGAVLLDTHVWIWLTNGSSELSASARQAIDLAAEREGVHIPAITVWEAAMLATKGRITLEPSVHQWVADALSQPGVELAPLTPEIAVESSCLPAGLEGDPADRLIVATARVLRIPLITRDDRILRYSKRGTLKTIRA